jgi:isopentenyl-diphosphate Delta-isomerase
MEFLSVVNDRDEVVGCAPRETIIRNGLGFRTVGILIENELGEFLIHRRSKTKITAPGKWTISVYGAVQSGEDYLTAALRELKEEMGVAVPANALQELVHSNFAQDGSYEFARIYYLPYTKIVCPDPAEIDEVIWVKREEIPQFLLTRDYEVTDRFKDVWDRIDYHFG